MTIKQKWTWLQKGIYYFLWYGTILWLLLIPVYQLLLGIGGLINTPSLFYRDLEYFVDESMSFVIVNILMTVLIIFIAIITPSSYLKNGFQYSALYFAYTFSKIFWDNNPKRMLIMLVQSIVFGVLFLIIFIVNAYLIFNIVNIVQWQLWMTQLISHIVIILFLSFMNSVWVWQLEAKYGKATIDSSWIIISPPIEQSSNKIPALIIAWLLILMNIVVFAIGTNIEDRILGSDISHLLEWGTWAAGNFLDFR